MQSKAFLLNPSSTFIRNNRAPPFGFMDNHGICFLPIGPHFTVVGLKLKIIRIFAYKLICYDGRETLVKELSTRRAG